jgi:hypothetical protein
VVAAVLDGVAEEVLEEPAKPRVVGLDPGVGGDVQGHALVVDQRPALAGEVGQGHRLGVGDGGPGPRPGQGVLDDLPAPLERVGARTEAGVLRVLLQELGVPVGGLDRAPEVVRHHAGERLEVLVLALEPVAYLDPVEFAADPPAHQVDQGDLPLREPALVGLDAVEAEGAVNLAVDVRGADVAGRLQRGALGPLVGFEHVVDDQALLAGEGALADRFLDRDGVAGFDLPLRRLHVVEDVLVPFEARERREPGAERPAAEPHQGVDLLLEPELAVRDDLVQRPDRLLAASSLADVADAGHGDLLALDRHRTEDDLRAPTGSPSRVSSRHSDRCGPSSAAACSRCRARPVVNGSTSETTSPTRVPTSSSRS